MNGLVSGADSSMLSDESEPFIAGGSKFISTRSKKRGVAFKAMNELSDNAVPSHHAPVKPRGILKTSTSSLSHEPADLNASVGGTPRNVLRERLRLKDQTISKLDTELLELQEFTRDELDIILAEKDSQLEALKTSLEQSAERCVNFFMKLQLRMSKLFLIPIIGTWCCSESS